jgi:hypothetical protein
LVLKMMAACAFLKKTWRMAKGKRLTPQHRRASGASARFAAPLRRVF